MGVSEKEAGQTIRISMSWQTTKADIDAFIKIWAKIGERFQHNHPQRESA